MSLPSSTRWAPNEPRSSASPKVARWQRCSLPRIPDRTHSIVVYGTMARLRKDADHPWGWADEAGLASLGERMRRGWGTIQGAEAAVPLWAESMVGDERFTHWLAKYARQSLSRDAILPVLWSNATFDLVDVFPAVRVPALLLHRRDDPLVPVSHGRWIAEHIPDGRFAELPGIDHLPFVGDAETVLAEMEDFLVGSRAPGYEPEAPHGRLHRHHGLTSSSTRSATTPGRAVGGARRGGQGSSRPLRRRRGEATRRRFPRRVRWSCPLDRSCFSDRRTPSALGVAVRVGMHTGECEVLDSESAGLPSHLAAQNHELAAPQEILVSSTVFRSRGRLGHPVRRKPRRRAGRDTRTDALCSLCAPW